MKLIGKQENFENDFTHIHCIFLSDHVLYQLNLWKK